MILRYSKQAVYLTANNTNLFVFDDLDDGLLQFVLLRCARLPVDNMGVCVEFVQRSDAIVDGVDACATLLVPPLIATPNLLHNRRAAALHLLLEHERLAQVEQLSLAASCLRVAGNQLVLLDAFYKDKKRFC